MQNKQTYDNAVFFDTSDAVWRELKLIELSNGIFAEIETSDIKFSKKISDKSKYVIPGLIDAHIHIIEEPIKNMINKFALEEPIENTAARVQRNLRQAAKNGITTIRDFGSFKKKSLEVRTWMKHNDLLHGLPRFLTTGGFFTKKDGHATDRGIIVGFGKKPIETVKQLINLGIDGIKIMNDPKVFLKSELQEIVDHAHQFALPVSVHIFSDQAARLAVDCGVDTLEHAGDFSDDTINQIMKKGTIVVPTFVAAFDTVIDPVGSMADELFEDADSELFRKWYLDECKVLPKLWKAGVKLACGTDAGFPGTDCGSLVREMMCWRMFDIPMEDILLAATRVSAEAVGFGDSIGKIYKGYSADYIVLTDNPITNPRVLFSPTEVWCRGKRLI